MKKTFILLIIFIIAILIMPCYVFAFDNCNSLETDMNRMLDKTIERLNYMEEQAKAGFYKEEQYFKELALEESKYKVWYPEYILQASKLKCQFADSTINKMTTIPKKFKSLKTLDLTKEAPACEYLGANTIALIQDVFNIIKLLVPALLILLGSFDLAKAVLAGNQDDMKKAQKYFIQRLIAGIAIYFIPMLLNLILSFIGITDATCSIA